MNFQVIIRSWGDFLLLEWNWSWMSCGNYDILSRGSRKIIKASIFLRALKYLKYDICLDIKTGVDDRHVVIQSHNYGNKQTRWWKEPDGIYMLSPLSVIKKSDLWTWATRNAQQPNGYTFKDQPWQETFTLLSSPIFFYLSVSVFSRLCLSLPLSTDFLYTYNHKSCSTISPKCTQYSLTELEYKIWKTTIYHQIHNLYRTEMKIILGLT